MSGIYIFPSWTLENIELGIEAGMWAVPQQKKKPSILGKARSMAIGDRVMLYHNGKKMLYGMFKITRLPDPQRVESKVWSGRFELPFEFAFCGKQRKPARVYTPFLMDLLPSLHGQHGPWSNHITKFRGLTVFQKQPLPDGDMIALEREFAARSEWQSN